MKSEYDLCSPDMTPVIRQAGNPIITEWVRGADELAGPGHMEFRAINPVSSEERRRTHRYRHAIRIPGARFGRTARLRDVCGA